MQKGSLKPRKGRWIFQFRRPMVSNGEVVWTNTSVSLGPAEGPKAITQQEAERRAAELIREVVGKAAPAQTGTEITVAEAADLFLYERAGDLSPRGHQHYEYLFGNFVIPRFGSRTMNSIRSSEIQAMLDELGKGYTYQTVVHIRGAMSALWKHSMRYDRADSDPVSPTRSSGRRPAPQRPLTPEECRRLLKELPPLVRELAEFLLLTGLRIGEALGLQRQDVNLTGRTAYIAGHVVPSGCLIVRRSWGMGRYGPPKTPKSVRVVPLTQHAEKIIRARLEKAGPSPDAPLFTTPSGAIIDAHNTARRVLKPAGERADVGWVHWHTFRHTAASLAELDAIERQRILGHTVMATTVRYTSPLADRVRQGLEAVEGAINGDAEMEGFDPAI